MLVELPVVDGPKHMGLSWGMAKGDREKYTALILRSVAKRRVSKDGYKRGASVHPSRRAPSARSSG